MKKRRDIEGVSLSFLDCICCGFGAIILLLVLTKIGEPLVIEETNKELEKLVLQLQQELELIRGETDVMTQDVTQSRQQLDTEQRRTSRLRGDLSTLEGEFTTTTQDSSIAAVLEGRLVRAQQSLTEEMKRLLGDDYRRKPDDSTVGGIPVDSEYVIFVVDTSGSMLNYSWPLAIRKLQETLDIYPQVKGIQVMNDMGQYMFSRYANKWIPDTPARRKAIIERMRTWNAFSNSSPVEGISRAIRTFYSPDKKISIYVFGDEFSGESIENVVNSVDRINVADASGNRLVRIHAIGFPYVVGRSDNFQFTGVRFATLMRILCERNGGTFVGLHEYRL